MSITPIEYCEQIAKKWHTFFADKLENAIFGNTKYCLALEEIYFRLSEVDENSSRAAFLESCIDYLEEKIDDYEYIKFD